MEKLADISMFENLQSSANRRMMSPMSVFNATVEDIKTSVESWMTQIDSLRRLRADAEAEAEQAKLEGVLDELNNRLDAGMRGTRTAVADLQKGGMGNDQSSDTPSVPSGGPPALIGSPSFGSGSPDELPQ